VLEETTQLQLCVYVSIEILSRKKEEEEEGGRRNKKKESPLPPNPGFATRCVLGDYATYQKTLY
jgi:hypothetical protein